VSVLIVGAGPTGLVLALNLARRGIRVRVIDDDESVRESLPDLLRACGLVAEAFSSAEAFLDSDYAGRTKCLILDVAMPGMSGPDLQLELIRRKEAIPIIFITADIPDKMRRGFADTRAVINAVGLCAAKVEARFPEISRTAARPECRRSAIRGHSGQAPPLSTHSRIFATKSSWLSGGVVRPSPGDHAQKTSGVSR